MIKKILEVVRVIFMISLMVGIILFCAYSDTHYSRTGFIKHAGLPNLYIFTDSNGNIWEFVDEDIYTRAARLCKNTKSKQDKMRDVLCEELKEQVEAVLQTEEDSFSRRMTDGDAPQMAILRADEMGKWAEV